MKLSRAILLSVVVHIVLIALMAFNYQFSKVEIKATGAAKPQIKATAVNSQRVEQLVKNLKQKDVNKQKQEQNRLDKLKKAQQDAKQKRLAEEKKTAEAKRKQKVAEDNRKTEEKKAADLKKKRIQDEKFRKQKADSDKQKKAEAERKKKAEAEKVRKSKAEAERKRQADAEKARQEAVEREMQVQMELDAAELNAAHQDQINDEVSKFATLIKGKVTRNWIEPEQKGYCVFKLNVAQGGLVIGVTVVEGDPLHCDSGQRAIFKSEPLPISKDPDVFEVLKSINLTLGEKQTNE